MGTLIVPYPTAARCRALQLEAHLLPLPLNIRVPFVGGRVVFTLPLPLSLPLPLPPFASVG